MSSKSDALLAQLQERFADRLRKACIGGGIATIDIAGADLLAVGAALRDEPAFAFAQLTDLAGMDYSTYGRADWVTQDATSTGFSRGVERGVVAERDPLQGGDRFAVVYHLLSLKHNLRMRLRAWAPGEPPTIASVIDLWPAASWFEREAFDMFGILFDGHPDLRRLLTDYGFIGHPFRKDFPLEGHVEVRFDPARGRVIYQPVSIEPRVLVPRVIRDDSRYEHPERAAAGKNA
ncbi:MAG: NADH-quinone oxidoreductase subunit C [Gammaproteobacteria bacterium]